MNATDNDAVRAQVRGDYARIATAGGGCSPGCCGPGASGQLGYSDAELAAVPDGANLGLGCGNPQAIADLRPGETVLDLGSGAGFDVFLAARQVGPQGRVIGVDMTPEMVRKARANAATDGVTNVEFRLGEIEQLPVETGTVDVVMSNCVINLSPEKERVFAEAFRVLRVGGRVAVSDVVLTQPLPLELAEQAEMLTGCVAGAALVDDIVAAMRRVGFDDVVVDVREESRAMIADWFPGSGAETYAASAAISATKPPAGKRVEGSGASSCCAPTCCG